MLWRSPGRNWRWRFRRLAWARLGEGQGGTRGVVVLGTLGTAFALVLFGLAHAPVTAICASVVAGVSSSAVLATLHVSAQSALPDWVRARGTRDILDRDLRIRDDRKRGMGARRRNGRLASGAFRGRGRRYLAHPIDGAVLETCACGRMRPFNRKASSPFAGSGRNSMRLVVVPGPADEWPGLRPSRLSRPRAARVLVRSPGRPSGGPSKQPS